MSVCICYIDDFFGDVRESAEETLRTLFILKHIAAARRDVIESAMLQHWLATARQLCVC
jgi:hypothetical protein